MCTEVGALGSCGGEIGGVYLLMCVYGLRCVCVCVREPGSDSC